MNAATPQRIQLKRVKGFRLQDVSQTLNSLPTVNVARPTIYGNHFRVEDIGRKKAVCLFKLMVTNKLTVKSIEKVIRNCTIQKGSAIAIFQLQVAGAVLKKDHTQTLKGKNLACWCPIDEPCHADVLLEITNQ